MGTRFPSLKMAKPGKGQGAARNGIEDLVVIVRFVLQAAAARAEDEHVLRVEVRWVDLENVAVGALAPLLRELLLEPGEALHFPDKLVLRHVARIRHGGFGQSGGGGALLLSWPRCARHVLRYVVVDCPPLTAKS